MNQKATPIQAIHARSPQRTAELERFLMPEPVARELVLLEIPAHEPHEDRPAPLRPGNS